jgi:hypothetical protein
MVNPTPSGREMRVAAWYLEPGSSKVETEQTDLRRREEAAFEKCLRTAAPGYEPVELAFDER